MKPKVLHLITRYKKGGAEANTRISCLALSKFYEVHLGFGRHDATETKKIQDMGIKTVHFTFMKHFRPISLVLSIFQVYRYIRKHRFIIVHTHSTEAGIVGRIAAALANTPVIIHTIHGSPFSKTRSYLLNKLVLTCERMASHLTTKIVSNADLLTEEYLRYGIGNQNLYTTIRSGINIVRFQEAKSIASMKKKGHLIIALISRITTGKGIHETLLAVKELDKVQLYIVGNGKMLSHYKRRTLNPNVHFLGYRTDTERIIASSDILVLPSYREGTPRAISEAMAAGKPIIATDVGGIPEQVRDRINGYLVPIRNPRILANRIEYLARNPKLCVRFGDQGKQRARLFDARQMTADLQRLYRCLLNRKSYK